MVKQKGLLAMELQKGQKLKLNTLTTSNQFILKVSASLRSGGADVTCFGVNHEEKLSDDRYFIFYNQPSSPEGAISMTENTSGTAYSIDLDKLPAFISKLVITLASDGTATMHELQKGQLALSAQNQELACFSFDGTQFSQEKALILCEIYKKDGVWRLSIVASGFHGGLSALLAHFGGEEAVPAQQPVPPAAAPTPTPPPAVSAPVNLKKQGDSHKINLSKNSGQIHVNLNWHSGLAVKKGLFGSNNGAIDLDLACMYRLKDGTQGVIQALGNAFGAKDRAPYILLDHDDRTGTNTNGENMWFKKPELIDFAVVFAYIYEGTPNWKNTGASVTLKQQDAPDIMIQIDSANSRDRFCVIASLTGTSGQLVIRREERFFAGHMQVDQAYGFGFRWKAGRK